MTTLSLPQDITEVKNTYEQVVTLLLHPPTKHLTQPDPEICQDRFLCPGLARPEGLL